MLALGLLLAIAPVRTQQVNGWVTDGKGLTAFSTTPRWCSEGSLASAVFTRHDISRAESSTRLKERVNSARCRNAGQPVRVAAVALLLAGVWLSLRRRPVPEERSTAPG